MCIYASRVYVYVRRNIHSDGTFIQYLTGDAFERDEESQNFSIRCISSMIYVRVHGALFCPSIFAPFLDGGRMPAYKLSRELINIVADIVRTSSRAVTRENTKINRAPLWFGAPCQRLFLGGDASRSLSGMHSRGRECTRNRVSCVSSDRHWFIVHTCNRDYLLFYARRSSAFSSYISREP